MNTAKLHQIIANLEDELRKAQERVEFLEDELKTFKGLRESERERKKFPPELQTGRRK